jgi:hypothetical protein
MMRLLSPFRRFAVSRRVVVGALPRYEICAPTFRFLGRKHISCGGPNRASLRLYGKANVRAQKGNYDL